MSTLRNARQRRSLGLSRISIQETGGSTISTRRKRTPTGAISGVITISIFRMLAHLYYRAMAGGRGWLGDTPGFNGDLDAILRSIKAKTLFILSPQDQLFPPQHVDSQVKAIPSARVVWIDSEAGHLIFGNADPNATRVMGDAISEFLRDLATNRNLTERGK